MPLKIISAGAGSGKTYRLTSEMVALLASGEVRASGIIATTFTKKAAAELQERVRVRLLEEGLPAAANDLTNALIGTVHGLGVKLLKRFAFEAGVSPQVDILAEEDEQTMFNQSLAMVLTNERTEEMEQLSTRLGLNKNEQYKTDWRKVLKELTAIARANDFSPEVLEKSKLKSWESFAQFLEPAESQQQSAISNHQLTELLEDAISRLENSGDATKVTADGVKTLKEFKQELRLRGELFWHQWVKISKVKVGAKSKDHLAELAEFANCHLSFPAFHDTVKSFIFNIFEIAEDAIREFESYKQHRGLIDYTDMEVLVKRLLDDPAVQSVLAEELDLLMVDEFQDTSPMQLEIFLKLSRLARHSIWVGDPKQSIYGFRGAEPALMEAIIQSQGGLQRENILEHSWRSRPDIVFATNAIFTKAFSKLPPEQVALSPKRKSTAEPQLGGVSPPNWGSAVHALHHWHFRYDGEGRQPGKEWLNHCIANALKINLERGFLILPKGEKTERLAQPGDVAILCRSNQDCKDMAEALHRAGLRAAISRAGLLGTAEAKLILACLKFMLNKYDSLSIAEILLLAARLSLEEIIESRLEYLELLESESLDFKWGEQNEFIMRLNRLRQKVVELSGAEILNLLLEEFDLRRIIVSWGNVEQRLANVDVLCRLALKYEENCNRLHSAASLGGFLLWLDDLEKNTADLQGSGENAKAVNVITYHKSKGLEYPVLICHNLEQSLRADVWGLAIVPEKPEVDLTDLLGNRWLRFWVNPYADQIGNTVLEERINASPVKASKTQEAREEEARLLYVGITRARDYLIFPSRQKPTLWVNRVCCGNEEHPALDAASSETTWDWEGKPQHIETEVFTFPADFPHADLPDEEVLFLENRAGRAVHLPYLLESGKENNGGFQVQILAEEGFGSPFILPEIPERQTIARAFHAFLAADQLTYPAAERLEMATGLLHRFELTEVAEGLLDAAIFLEKSDAFFGWVKEKFPVKKVHRRFPIRFHQQGRLFENSLDLLLETGGGLAAVWHSPFVGDAKSQQKKLREMGASLKHSRTGLQLIFDQAVVQLWVHFGLYGKVFQVEVS